MIILVVLTFVLCWTPLYAVTAVTQLQPVSFLRHSQFLFTMLATHWAGFSSSAANPLIYAAMSYQFRRSFKQVGLRPCADTNLKLGHKVWRKAPETVFMVPQILCYASAIAGAQRKIEEAP